MLEDTHSFELDQVRLSLERRGVYARQAVSVAVNRIGTRTDPRGILDLTLRLFSNG